MITVNWTDKSTDVSKQINLDGLDLTRLSKKVSLSSIEIKQTLNEGKTIDTGLHTYKMI